MILKRFAYNVNISAFIAVSCFIDAVQCSTYADSRFPTIYHCEVGVTRCCLSLTATSTEPSCVVNIIDCGHNVRLLYTFLVPCGIHCVIHGIGPTGDTTTSNDCYLHTGTTSDSRIPYCRPVAHQQSDTRFCWTSAKQAVAPSDVLKSVYRLPAVIQ